MHGVILIRRSISIRKIFKKNYNTMAIFYHGSSTLFPRLDLSHDLEGDG